MERQMFEQMYQGQAPWDIPRPQKAVIEAAEAGEIQGSVLDVGCGTGENVMYLAEKGHEAWGLDFVPAAIGRARTKADKRGLKATFVVGNALKLTELGRQFDTIIDCGLFHTFSDDERPKFVEELSKRLRIGGRLVILCFSDEEPGTDGPRRVTQAEIRSSFANGWNVERIEPRRFEVVDDTGELRFSPGGPKAWLAVIQRK